jgi:hypothetical protein
MKHVNSEQELQEANKLVSKIPKFSGQKGEIQLDEFVRQIETYADSVGWIDDEKGENEDICLLSRRNLEGQAEQMWRLMDEKNLINLYLWKDVKRKFQEKFSIQCRNMEQIKSEEKQCQAFTWSTRFQNSVDKKKRSNLKNLLDGLRPMQILSDGLMMNKEKMKRFVSCSEQSLMAKKPMEYGDLQKKKTKSISTFGKTSRIRFKNDFQINPAIVSMT